MGLTSIEVANGPDGVEPDGVCVEKAGDTFVCHIEDHIAFAAVCVLHAPCVRGEQRCVVDGGRGGRWCGGCRGDGSGGFALLWVGQRDVVPRA